MFAIYRSIEGMVQVNDTKDQPAPKFLQQMAKGQFFLVPGYGLHYPKAMDILATYDKLQASDDFKVQYYFVLLAYSVTYDPRDGEANWDAAKMVGVCFRAWNRYLSKEARVAICDTAGVEWDGEGVIPLVVIPFNKKSSYNTFATAVFINMSHEAPTLEHIRQKFTAHLGLPAVMALAKGLTGHPLFHHLQGVVPQTSYIHESLRFLAEDIYFDFRADRSIMSALHKAVCNVAFESIAKPIANRFSPGETYTDKAKAAAGEEYVAAASQMIKLLTLTPHLNGTLNLQESVINHEENGLNGDKQIALRAICSEAMAKNIPSFQDGGAG